MAAASHLSITLDITTLLLKTASALRILIVTAADLVRVKPHIHGRIIYMVDRVRGLQHILMQLPNEIPNSIALSHRLMLWKNKVNSVLVGMMASFSARVENGIVEHTDDANASHYSSSSSIDHLQVLHQSNDSHSMNSSTSSFFGDGHHSFVDPCKIRRKVRTRFITTCNMESRVQFWERRINELEEEGMAIFEMMDHLASPSSEHDEIPNRGDSSDDSPPQPTPRRRRPQASTTAEENIHGNQSCSKSASLAKHRSHGVTITQVAQHILECLSGSKPVCMLNDDDPFWYILYPIIQDHVRVIINDCRERNSTVYFKRNTWIGVDALIQLIPWMTTEMNALEHIDFLPTIVYTVYGDGDMQLCMCSHGRLIEECDDVEDLNTSPSMYLDLMYVQSRTCYIDSLQKVQGERGQMWALYANIDYAQVEKNLFRQCYPSATIVVEKPLTLLVPTHRVRSLDEMLIPLLDGTQYSVDAMGEINDILTLDTVSMESSTARQQIHIDYHNLKANEILCDTIEVTSPEIVDHISACAGLKKHCSFSSMTNAETHCSNITRRRVKGRLCCWDHLHSVGAIL